MIIAQREMLGKEQAALILARSELLVGKLELERLKLMLAKLRRERFGQSSERGKLLVEQLELAIEDLEEAQGEEETKAEIAVPAAGRESGARTPRGPRKLPDNIPVSASSSPGLVPVANAEACGCTSSAKSCRRRWNANRAAGKSSSMCAKSSRAGIVRRSRSRPRRRIPFRAALRGRACWR